MYGLRKRLRLPESWCKCPANPKLSSHSVSLRTAIRRCDCLYETLVVLAGLIVPIDLAATGHPGLLRTCVA